MKYEDIFCKTVELLSTITKVEEITPESELMGDLDIGSMALLSLLCSLEAEFDIHLPERTIRKVVTVEDLVDTIQGMI